MKSFAFESPPRTDKYGTLCSFQKSILIFTFIRSKSTSHVHVYKKMIFFSSFLKSENNKKILENIKKDNFSEFNRIFRLFFSVWIVLHGEFDE